MTGYWIIINNPNLDKNVYISGAVADIGEPSTVWALYYPMEHEWKSRDRINYITVQGTVHEILLKISMLDTLDWTKIKTGQDALKELGEDEQDIS